MGNIIKKLVLLNFMDMMISVSVIFYNAYNSECDYNYGYFVDIEEKTFPVNLKVTSKGFEIYRFIIVQYSISSASGCMIVFQFRHTIFLGLQRICTSFTNKTYIHQKGTRVPSYIFFTMIMLAMRSSN